MVTYVKAYGSSQYHWCKNCRKYPKHIEKTTTVRPEGYLCDECKAKERNNDCRLR